MKIIHPRPNPIVAAMYTLRDLNVDVIVVHGPAGCCFMASRMLEEAGVRVVTSGMREDELIFGGTAPLVETLKLVEEKRDYAIKVRDTNFLFDVMGKKYKLEAKVLPEDTSKTALQYVISASDKVKETLSIDNLGEISFTQAYNSPVSLDVFISTTDMSNIKIDVYMIIARYK